MNAAPASSPPLRQLLRELITHHTITVVTTPGDVPPVERGPLDAVTVIQLDGGVITRIAAVSRAEAHFTKVRAALASLARLQRMAKLLRWPLTVGGQLWWLEYVVCPPGESCRQRLEELAKLPNELPWLLAKLAFGGAGGWVFHRYTPRLLLWVLRRWARRLEDSVLSGPGPGA
jgi:hypothetical protein